MWNMFTKGLGMKDKYYLGVDLGAFGAWALVKNGVIVERCAMPKFGGKFDPSELYAQWFMLGMADNIHAVFEKVNAFPGQGVNSMFTFGKFAGMIEGFLIALEIPYTAVPPQTWTKELHKGIEAKLDAKSKSYMAAARLFPKENWLASDRSKVAHSGIIDAVLLAEYGRRKNL